MYNPYIKRILDIALSLLLIIILCVPYLVICLLCLFVHGTPLFYTQQRAGINEKNFNIFKLRTMNDLKDDQGELLPDKERLTRFGAMLRRSSLDEVPGVWNVLKGDMSLIGPRPLLVEYLPLYTKEQAKRHIIRPGITGWAQVNGRNAISWEKKFDLDIWYVNNLNFWLDFKILLLTVKKVFVKEGISADGQVTMSKFTGSKVVEKN